ncbi:tetratricopeptide repeat protein, partial [Candidatus Sumerlaeota bacterium]|nr:tetratricopeptide repeat protein [Candidatus Sumerlaeota bacterium]
VKIQPDNDTLLGLLADSQISQNRVEEAAKTLKLLIDHFRERGEYEPAIERARQIVDLQSSSLDSRELLGSVLFDADHHEEAVETWRSIGEELVEAGDLDSAAERFDKILKHAERDVAALRSAADLTRKARGDEAALAPYERLIEVIVADGTPQEVEKEFERLLEGNDKESTLRLHMGEKYGSYLHSAGKTEEAAKQFLGISKIMLGPRDDAEEALRVVRILRELDPANPAALDEEATILAKMGETEKAGAVLLDLAEVHRDYAEEDRAAEVLLRRADLLPDDVAAQVAAGEAFEALDDADRAKTLYFRGIEIHDRRREPAPCIPLFKKVLNLNPPERMKIEVVLGQAYAQAGQTEEAVEQLLLVGAKYEENSEQDNAARLYRRIKRISPEALEPRWRLVRYAESKQDNAAALKELREMSTISVTLDDPEQSVSILQLILKLDPKDLNSRVALAGSFRKAGQDSELFEALGSLEQLYRESGEIDLAITILEELRTLRPDDLDIVHRSFELRIKKHEVPEAVGIAFELIESYLRNQRTDDAVAMMRRIVELDPKDVARRVSLARLVESEGHPEIALEELRKGWEELFNKNLDEECLKLCEDAQEFFPDEIILRKCLVETLRRKGPMERAVQERISLAELLESKGEVQDAFQTLEEILADHPDYFAAHQVIVELAERSGEVEKAVEHLALLADIHFKARKLPDAIKALERAVELAPGRGEFQIQLAELNHETGAGERARDLWMNAAQNLRSSDKVQEAIKIYEKVRTLYPGDVEPLVPLVDCYREAGDDDLYLGRGVQLGKVYLDGEAFSDAIGVYEALGERFGKNPEVWDALAESYEKSGDMDGAVRCWKHLAELHEAEKRNKRAKDYLERALKAVAADVEILRLLGELCLRLKQKDEGLKHLSDAASSLQESGKLDEARAIVDVILKEDPKNNRLLRLRGSLQEDLGDMAAAVKDYAEAAGGAAEAGDRAFAIELFSHLLELDPSRNQDREAYARALE